MSTPNKRVQDALIDISGVLRVADKVIPGAVDAYKRLRDSGCRIQFISNTDSITHENYLRILRGWGFDVSDEEVFTAPQAAKQIILKESLHPLLLIPSALLPDLVDVGVPCDRHCPLPPSLSSPSSSSSSSSAADNAPTEQEPDSVVLAYMAQELDFAKLNAAFRVLIRSQNARLIALSRTRYYRAADGELSLDVGPFAAALEAATGKTATISGKPSPDFFKQALERIQCEEEEAVMIGDDVETDVGGAQAVGVRGVLVRTGKYTPADETHPTVKPHLIVDDFSAAVDWILKNRQE